MFTILVLSLCLTELGQVYSRMHIWEREMVESRTKRGGLLVLWVEKGDRRLLQELKAMRPRSGLDQQPHTLRSENMYNPNLTEIRVAMGTIIKACLKEGRCKNYSRKKRKTAVNPFSLT